MVAEPHQNVKQMVKHSYDKMAPKYLEFSNSIVSPREQYLEKLFSYIGPDRLPKATMLELGCGAGVPATLIIASKCQHLVANDISSTQISMARKHLQDLDLSSKVDLIESDMASLAFASSSFDAIAGFYSTLHLPLPDQQDLIFNIGRWLKPNGHVLINFGAEVDKGRFLENYCGAKTFECSLGTEKVLGLFKSAGLEVLEQNIRKGDDSLSFLWIIARKR